MVTGRGRMCSSPLLFRLPLRLSFREEAMMDAAVSSLVPWNWGGVMREHWFGEGQVTSRGCGR